MRYLLVLLFAPLLCLGQNNKREINRLVKELNTKLVSDGPSSSEKFVLSVNDAGYLQIERTLNAPKVVSKKFTYSMCLKDTDYVLDSQTHDGKTLYAFVFKDKRLNKSIKQVIKSKAYNSSRPESEENDSFVKLIIPLTLTIDDEDIKFCSDTITQIFELAKNEDSYFSAYGY